MAMPLRPSLVVIAAALALACRPPNSSSSTCNPEPLLTCESEVEYQGRHTKGSASFMGVGAGGETELKALRSVDEQVERMAAEHLELCKQHNACIIDKAEYRAESQKLRERHAKLPLLMEAIKTAPDAEARRQAIREAWSTVVPEPRRTELRLTYAVAAKRPADSAMVSVRSGETLPSGSRLAFGVHVSKPAHVYLVQRKGDKKKLEVLFPDPQIPVKNPLPALTTVRIPGDGQSYVLDAEDLGREQVFVIASLRALSDLESKLAALTPQSSDALAGALAGVAAAGRSDECTRGLTLDGGTRDCSLSRGLALAPEQGASLGMAGAPPVTLTSEAADDTIFAVFSFDHTQG